MSSKYDVVVLGAGAVGSAAAWQLAKRGLRVAAIDRFVPPHDRGSSHGQTRVIRQAYFEHADYVPLLLRAYELWRQLERDTESRLLEQVGLLEVGPATGKVVPGVLRAAAQHGLKVEPLPPGDVARRWPGMVVPAELEAVYEPAAGFLHVEASISAQLNLAASHGANLLLGTAVDDWQVDNAGITVTTSRGRLCSERLVVAAGAWAGGILESILPPLEIRRKSVFWYTPTPAARDWPTYLYELPHGVFYGFPALAAAGAKVGEHSGGQVVDDPLAVDREVDPHEAERVSKFVSQHLPGLTPVASQHSTCLYTMSPDEHFVIDQHPHWPQIVFAVGLSGHGFKFGPVLGELLADLVTTGESPPVARFLGLSRFDT